MTEKSKPQKPRGCAECWKMAEEKGMVALYELVCKKASE